MVHDAMVTTSQPRAIHCFARGVTNPKPHKSYDYIMRPECARRIVRQTNSIPWRRLPGNCAICLRHRTRALQPDHSGYAKNNRARTFALHGRTKAAWNGRLTFCSVVIIEIRHFYDSAAAAAARESAISFGRRKRQEPGAKAPDFAFDRLRIAPVDLINSPEVCELRVECSVLRGKRLKSGVLQTPFEFWRRSLGGVHRIRICSDVKLMRDCSNRGTPRKRRLQRNMLVIICRNRLNGLFVRIDRVDFKTIDDQTPSRVSRAKMQCHVLAANSFELNIRAGNVVIVCCPNG